MNKNKPKPYDVNDGKQHVVLEGTKICTVCNKEYPATDEFFYKQLVRNKSGKRYRLSAQCKECARLYSVGYIQEHAEQHSYYEKEIWREKNRKEINAKQKRWREENKEFAVNQYNEYIQQHPEKLREYNRNRRNKNHKITKIEWENCKSYFNYQCAYCGMTEEEHKEKYNQQLHKEHAIFDGLDDLSNCIPSCKYCNSYKSQQNYQDWYTEGNPVFNQDRLNKINKWLSEDYKIYIKQSKSR